jgi:hypothetical protein
MKYENEIQQVLAIQNQIIESKKEVSNILDKVIIQEKGRLTLGSRIVLNGELWEITRWPWAGAANDKEIKTWCLKSKGKVLQ